MNAGRVGRRGRLRRLAPVPVDGDVLAEALIRSNTELEYLRALFMEAPTPALVIDPFNLVRSVNRAATALVGFDPVGHPRALDAWIPWSDRDAWAALVTSAREGVPSSRSLTIRRASGERRRCDVVLQRLPDGAVLVLLYDREAEHEALRRQQLAGQRVARLWEDTSDGVIIADLATGVIEEANEALGRLIRRPTAELITADLRSLFVDSDVWRLDAWISAGRRTEPLILRLRRDRDPLTVEATLGVLREGERRLLTLVVRDVTERERASAERDHLVRTSLKSQKLAALGQLAAGVAHDMNNILTAILSWSDPTVAVKLADQTEALAEIRNAADRGAALMAQLRRLFQPRPDNLAPFDLRRIVEEAAALLRRSLPRRVALTVALPAVAVVLNGDEGAWHQAIVNLAINARDAMPAGGQLSITLTLNGREAALQVSDTGEGMSPEVQERAFEPFFTTKTRGAHGGSGLGLAQVDSAVRTHGGTISCSSTPGVGTRFVLRVPTTEDTPPVVSAPRTGPIAPVQGRIALVDDDPLTLRSVQRWMERRGLTVDVYPDGMSFIRALEAGPLPAVLLTDLSMPGMSGAELLFIAQRRWPQVPVLVYSGDVSDAQRDALLASGACSVLQKPFTEPALLGALSEAIARVAGAA